MKRGFTLVELLVVIGLMAVLGVAATGGYSAFQKGMVERGAAASVSSVLKAAKERAFVDRVPTIVYCYNRMIREADDENNAVIQGEAVAIRRSGRVTFVKGKYICDEFADLGHNYDVVDDTSDLEDRGSMKLWLFNDKEDDMKYANVADAVYALTGSEDYPVTDLQSGTNISDFVAYAFYDKGGSKSPATFKVGDGYGYEFTFVQLPQNFIFGGSGKEPNQVETIVKCDRVFFDPSNGFESENGEVEIYFCRPDSSGLPKADSTPVAKASSKEAAS